MRVSASQTTLVTGPTSAHVYVTNVPTPLLVLSQSEVEPDGAVGGSPEQPFHIKT